MRKIWDKLPDKAKVVFIIYAMVFTGLVLVVTFVAASTYWLYGADGMVVRGVFIIATIVCTIIAFGIKESM